MNKAEAIKAMKSGKKVTHRSCTRDEWATMEAGKILLEDGVICNPFEFWLYWYGPNWEEGWELWIDTAELDAVLDYMPKRYKKFMKQLSKHHSKILRYSSLPKTDWNTYLLTYWIDGRQLMRFLMAANFNLDIQFSKLPKL